MDFYGIERGSIRSRALTKLVKISLNSKSTGRQVESKNNTTHSNIERIASGIKFQKKDVSSVPMTKKEFEILVCLADSCYLIPDPATAELLFDKLKLYFLEVFKQEFTDGVISSVSPNPWDFLTRKLTVGLSWIAIRFPNLGASVVGIFNEYLGQFDTSKDTDLELLQIFSLYGFINGLLENSKFFLHVDFKGAILLKIVSVIEDKDYELLKTIEKLSYSSSSPYLVNYQSATSEFSSLLIVSLFQKLLVAVYSDHCENSDKLELVQFLLRQLVKRADAIKKQELDQELQSDLGSTSENSFFSEDVPYVTANEKLIPTAHLQLGPEFTSLVAQLQQHSMKIIKAIDEGADFIWLSTSQRIELCYSAKAAALQVLSLSIFQMLLPAEDDHLVNIVTAGLSHPHGMNNYDLSTCLVSLSALIIFKLPDSPLGSLLVRVYSLLISTPDLSPRIAHGTSRSLSYALKALPQDTVVSTLYSLINLVAASSDGVPIKPRPPKSAATFDTTINASSMSLNSSSEYQNSADDLNATCEHIFQNAIDVVLEIVRTFNDPELTTLVVTMFSQKIEQSTYLVPLLTKGLARCAPYCLDREFVSFNRLFSDLVDKSKSGKKNAHLLKLVTAARIQISELLRLQPDNGLYRTYLTQLMRGIVNRGDVQKNEQHHRSHTEISEVAHDISQFLQPLAMLLPDIDSEPAVFTDIHVVDLFKNTWYNLVVHGYAIGTKLTQQFEPELRRIAHSSPPLASESSWNRTETSLELNSVLKRGSSTLNIKLQKDFVGSIFETSAMELRTLSTAKVMFLSAAAFLETLRVSCGDFSTVLEYFSDPTIKISGVEKFIGSLAVHMTQSYVKSPTKKIENIAQQLQTLLIFCCHRDYNLQDAAFQCCDIFIKRLPSSLCHHVSLFTLLDLLTLLYQSIVDLETNIYDPKYVYQLPNSDASVTLSDSVEWRKSSLARFHEMATKWVSLTLGKCDKDLKALLQAYINKTDSRKHLPNSIQLGVSFALKMGSTILSSDKEYSSLSDYSKFKEINTVSGFLNSYTDDLVIKIKHLSTDSETTVKQIYLELARFQASLDLHAHVAESQLTETMEQCAGLIIHSQVNSGLLIRYVVSIPFAVFNAFAFKLAVRLWMTIIKERPQVSTLLLFNVALGWENSIKQRKGLFSTKHDLKKPEFSLMEYSPSDKLEVAHAASVASHGLQPHLQVIYFLQSHLEATMYQSVHITKVFTKMVVYALKNIHQASYHPFARLVRFELITLALRLNKLNSNKLTDLILDASLDFFKARARFPHGSNRLKIKTDYNLLIDVASTFKELHMTSNSLELKRAILLAFLDSEINNIGCFLNPLNPPDTAGKFLTAEVDDKLVPSVYNLSPSLAFNLVQRYKLASAHQTLATLVLHNPLKAYACSEAVSYAMNSSGKESSLYTLLFLKSVSVPDAINLLINKSSDPILTQLSVRSLSENINVSFFYVPQIVQALRYDKSGYVERFILEAANVSQLFAHQIIWNMNANKYHGDEGEVEDSLKPTLDAVQKKITSALSALDLDFYRREFAFFEEVTGISGKLKPYIKKTKAEKKAKIDEEMSKIKVLKDVYLPSNPDGVVIDINRKSGKPLQSHAKAPFMATFRIRKEAKTYSDEDEDEAEAEAAAKLSPVYEEKWLSAIFKVGDDCRQDVLSLQLISVFRTIWMNAGLDLYVFPYRVTATSPGCGVIDVLPNSISRDMLGREAVNGLYQYFITKFGPETSVEFQNARNNFAKSLAAYSVISYIFQFKDRHNGNIMYDNQGHILHIDFGFIFDIVPGGVKFEQSPFKLTKEMVDVLGGGTETQAYQWFEELCVKAFLTIRPHMETIVDCIVPMLDSGLPCFKPSTINNLRNRFVPNKSERDASHYMRKLIRKSYESLATKGYDEFQRLTNGIPY